ncbi:MAG TPA: UDP-N-acetylenolpyruvoylglucosamine reductase [Candidatus Magasanikbacteria bacterium]|nr:MAG: UDP-N-acetylenolpyruvoylglucosamine reductase [Candidatus Magasanikbacteria bacterium GW2011_GWA2_43_9]HBB38597.1 UDP-N-acetylenolpyruvoylglucosamine reductase [Candidatus Magasanikbacteria bacterium]HCC13855.1 UDP-N-acetylenolpyruvoylglucosamine reductase [Candidatus Magasanikbacteria bacterium]HCM53347.1 UDP-N-acetylenolpyruvoylglucosamine reductase [Candidatus Magasanikbacteria bacterium]
MVILEICVPLLSMQDLYKKFKDYGKVKLNEPLAKHTTFKIGGPASFFVTVTETKKLVELLTLLDGKGIDYFIHGGGSNTLASDAGYVGVVVDIKTRNTEVQEDVFIADAGCVTVAVAQKSMSAGLTGFEWGVGVPGTIGGAVRGNAGAMGGDMKKDILKVEVYKDGEVITMTNEECEFGYRDSVFKHDGGVILRVYLQLKKAEPDAQLMKKALEHLQYRNSTQPQGFASSGCIFKNPECGMSRKTGSRSAGQNAECLEKLREIDAEKMEQFEKVGKISAGWLIEQAGLKGKKRGKVEISDKHGNFMLNTGGASADDVLGLIDEVKQEVYTRFGIELEEEVAIL